MLGVMSAANRILNNTLYNVAGRVWVLLVNFLLTPIILSYLGTERFAIWALFWAFSNYLMLIDFGLASSFHKRVAEIAHQQRTLDMNYAFNTTLFFYLSIGIIVVIIAWSFGPWLIQLANISDTIKPDVHTVILWGAPIFFLIGVLHVFDAFFRGNQKFDFINAGMVFVSTINIIAICAVLKLGWGMNGLLGSTAFVYCSQIVLYWFLSLRIFPGMRVSTRYFHYPTLRRLLPFGTKMQISMIAEIISMQIDKVLLAYFVPLKFVTFYDLGAKISTILTDVPYSLTAALFPATVKEYSDESHARLKKIYKKGNKYLFTITVPMLIGVLLTAHLIIGAWLGQVSVDVRRAAMFLSGSYWIMANMSIVFIVATAGGWAMRIMQGAVIQAVLNIVLSWLLIWQFGFEGALVGTMVSVGISQIYVLVGFYRDFEYSIREDAITFYRALAVNTPATLICYGFIAWANHWIAEGQRIDSFIALITAVFIYVVVYLASIRFFRYFDVEDSNLLKQHIPVMSWLVRL